jgi:hypothetical protein
VKPKNAASTYARFLLQVVRLRAVWTLTCQGDVCAVHDGWHRRCLPLWSDGSVAREMRDRHWPSLEPAPLALEELLADCLPASQQANVPVGIGVAVGSHAIVVPAARLADDLRAAQQMLEEMRAN